jgi:signal transduction histidine kinase
MWGIVERQSRYLARIVDQVMELSHGAHDEAVLSRDWFDLGTMITNAVETVKPLLLQRGHRLTVSMPPDQVYVLADALRMQQVVINLLTNAAKYTPPGGRIILGFEVVDDLVRIEVRDNGTGISADLLPRVFDLFRQGDKPRAGGFAGLGMGSRW